MSSPTADLGRDLGGIAAEDMARRRRLRLRWRRRSALVHVMRKLLPALGLGMLALIGAWTAMNTLLRSNAARNGDAQNIRMLRPRFQGRTEAGKPFVLVAASAMRSNQDANRVSLDRPVLTLGAGPPDQTIIKAVSGVYREDTYMLVVDGDVHLDDAKGNHFITEHALVDTKKDNVTGQNAIQGDGPLGRIAGSAYALHDSGAYIHVDGRVKSRIEQHGSGPAPAAQAH